MLQWSVLCFDTGNLMNTLDITLKPETLTYLKDAGCTHYDTGPGVDSIYFFRLKPDGHTWQMSIITPRPKEEFDHVLEWYRCVVLPVATKEFT